MGNAKRSNLASTRRDLRDLPPDVRAGVHGSLALTLAALLDDDPRPREAAMLSRELRQIMADLWAMAPRRQPSPLDELAERREARMAEAEPAAVEAAEAFPFLPDGASDG